MSFSKRQGNDAVCYTKPLDSLKSWNDRFFWVDAFACPASFPWYTSKSASKDLFPKSSQYDAEHYATLVAYPAPSHKYPEPFLCLIGISQMDLLSFIQTADPTKVRISERQSAKASSELEASVDKLFDEGGRGSHAEQGNSVSGGHGVGVPQVSETAKIVVEDAAPVQPRRQRKRKTDVSDADEPSHPPKKLREDHETSTRPSVAGKSRSALQRLLARAVLNPEVEVVALPTLPFITSSVSVTPERRDGDQLSLYGRAKPHEHYYYWLLQAEVDSFARPSVPLMTMTTIVTSTVDPTTIAKEKFIESSIFGGGSFSGAEHTVGGFSCLTGSDFIVGGIRTVVSPDTDLQKFFSLIRGMEHDELFTEFNVGAARQISLSVEVRMRAKFNIREKRRLSAVVKEKNSLLKARDEDVASLKAQLLVKEAEAVTPPKSGRIGKVTMGCYVKVQKSRYRKRP
ncbi:hypothetical protein Tco_1548251 [Tanacetum coccineum]